MFGFSGPSGIVVIFYKHTNIKKILLRKHCCLWCLCTKEDIQLPSISAIVHRTTESIFEDYKMFVSSGGNLRNAKTFNNVVRKPFFRIPLSRVYIKMIFHNNCTCTCRSAYQACIFHLEYSTKCFTSLEEDCHVLDQMLASDSNSKTESSTTAFQKFKIATITLSKLKHQLETAQKEVTAAEQLKTYLSLVAPIDQTQQIEEVIIYNNRLIAELVSYNVAQNTFYKQLYIVNLTRKRK